MTWLLHLYPQRAGGTVKSMKLRYYCAGKVQRSSGLPSADEPEGLHWAGPGSQGQGMPLYEKWFQFEFI